MKRLRFAIVGVVALLLLVAAYLIVAFRYSVEHGDTWNVGEGAIVEQGVARQVLRPSRTVEIVVTIRNPGALPIAFTGAQFQTPDLETTLTRMIERAGEGPLCCLPSHAVGFHPVTIEPGKQLMLWMSLRITGINEYSPCSGFTLEQVLVSYAVLKISRVEPVTLHTPIMFQTPC